MVLFISFFKRSTIYVHQLLIGSRVRRPGDRHRPPKSTASASTSSQRTLLISIISILYIKPHTPNERTTKIERGWLLFEVWTAIIQRQTEINQSYPCLGLTLRSPSRRCILTSHGTFASAAAVAAATATHNIQYNTHTRGQDHHWLRCCCCCCCCHDTTNNNTD